MRESVANLLVGQERRLSKSFASEVCLLSCYRGGGGRRRDTFFQHELCGRMGQDHCWYRFPKITSTCSSREHGHDYNNHLGCLSLVCLVPAFTQRTRELIVTFLANAIAMFFYGAPLSTIWTVLREKNSSSIHIRTMLANTLTGLFWTAYGIAVSDLFLAIPNGLGAGFGAIQIIFCVLSPRKASGDSLGEDDENRDLNERKAAIGFPVKLNESQCSVIDVERNEEPLWN